MVKCVLFDLGGVYFEDGTKKFLQLLSSRLNKTYEDLYPLFREGKSLEYRENKLSGDTFFKWAANQLENQISPSELNSLWVSQYTEIAGTREVILDLKAKNIKVVALSDNVPERVKFLQDKYHFKEIFDKVILSYEVNLTKKSRDIFLLALKTVGMLPSEAIFVDDRQEILDVANGVGLKTVLFTSPEQLKEDINEILKSYGDI